MTVVVVFFALAASLLAVRSDAACSSAPVLRYQDGFNDGDFSNPEGANGLTWSIVWGNGRVSSVDGSYRLGPDRGASLLVTTQRLSVEGYTVRLNARLTWSAHGRFVVLYKDANNYYSVEFGSAPGIYRKLNGNEVRLHSDPESLIRLPHASASSATFKIHACNDGGKVLVRVDKAGDGVDYDIEASDFDPTAVSMFRNAAVGVMNADTSSGTPYLWVDDVAVYEGLLSDPYVPATYYVDRNHASAGDANPGTENLPWATIQHAAQIVKAGDTVVVKAGTYPERVTFPIGTRGAPGQIISFRSQPRRAVTMWGFDTLHAHYLRVEGFSVTTDASLTGWTERNGVFLRSDHVQVVDNYLYDWKSNAIAGESTGTYVAWNRIYRCQAGIGVSGYNWLVEHNEVERLYDHGGGDCDYSRFFGDNHVIRSNYFHGTIFSEIGSAHVDCFQTFDNNGEFVHDVVVEGNRCSQFHQAFMGEAYYYHDIMRITFKNNVFFDGGAWGLCVHDIPYVTAMNNTFANISHHGIGLRGSYAHHALIKNNVFYSIGTSYWASDGAQLEGDYNLTFDTQPPPLSGTHDLIGVDPRFVDAPAKDFHLRVDSPAIDHGQSLPEVAQDFDGIPRPQGRGWDIGAYEFPWRQAIVSKEGDGAGRVTSSPSGIDCGSTCSAYFTLGSTVTLAADPDAGSIFSGWSGACTGLASCVLTMDADKSVTARFELPYVSVNDVSIVEGNAGSTGAIFAARLSRTSNAPVTVQYATTDGTAFGSVDYTVLSGTMTFAPGATISSLSVQVIGDTADEPNERFYLNLTGSNYATIADNQGVGSILDDDGGAFEIAELTHGFDAHVDLAARPGPTPDEDLYVLLQSPHSSYEIVVDEASGDVGPGSGPALEQIAADGTTVLRSATAVGLGPSRTLRTVNSSPYATEGGYVRVRSAACTTDCGADDVYRIRAYCTTYTIARFNNSGSQITVLVLQNPTDTAIMGQAYFWSSSGSLLASQSFLLAAQHTLVLNTNSISGASGKSGTISVVHDGRYGDLAGKAVSLEPATGFSFDTSMLPRQR